ncbi:ABC transporter ATP-binding protein [Membranihabitans marinus]|uniref:ABC transporter ATP-binding protein n=1 Tax=Membranihabitans marinus TaxID=1227546 RepID=UPI001F00CA10|nr:ATP-binding cassette domain-containing protein [Membranihabitans marinus]
MFIEIESLTKEYNYSTIFENISDTFSPNHRIAVLGENGSGKSTFLKVLCGMVDATQGKIRWRNDDRTFQKHQWFQYFSFSSPQLFFGDQMTVEEVFHYFMRLKSFQKDIDPQKALDILSFEVHRDKPLKRLSSGMYQRIRLVLTICTDAPVLFLDEPCSNLDKKGVDLYHQLIDEYGQNRMIFVASNDEREYDFCDRMLSITDYK